MAEIISPNQPYWLKIGISKIRNAKNEEIGLFLYLPDVVNVSV